MFDRVLDVLAEVGYVAGRRATSSSLTDAGRTLQRIYGERDLLVAECLRRGLWDGLDAPSLAAMACALVFEPRRDDGSVDPRDLPRGRFRIAWERTQELWAELDDLEHDNRLPGIERPSAGLAGAMHAWARGSSLDAVLEDADMAAGDFVRWAKQTIDLLDQLSIVAPERGDRAHGARRARRRAPRASSPTRRCDLVGPAMTSRTTAPADAPAVAPLRPLLPLWAAWSPRRPLRVC